MAQRLIVEIIGDSKSVERAFVRTERSAKKFEGTMARTSRSVNSSLGMLGITPGVAGGAGAFLLGRQFVNAARNAEVILGQTEVAFRDAGLAWTDYAKRVQDASKQISDSSAFDDEAVLQSIQVFIRGQKDAGRSIELAGLAADVARGRYIDLDQATQLVNKAAMGQVGALRRAGIQIDKNATSAQALDALQKAYSGSAEKYAESSVGATERLSVAWENLAEQAGGPLASSLAVVAEYLTRIVVLMDRLGGMKLPDLPGGGGGGTFGNAFKYALLFGPNLFKSLFGGGGGGDDFSGTGDTGGGGDFPITGRSRGSFLDANQAIAQANKTIGGISAFINKWTAVGKQWDDAQKAAAARRARNALARQRFQASLENQWGWLEFGLEKAQATKTLADDRRILKKQEQWLLNRIAHAGRTLELVTKLWRVRQQIRDLNKSKAKGLDADPLAGLMQVSSKRMAGILAAGTGLGAAGLGRLQQNIAGQEITVYSNVLMDGQTVGRAVTRQQTATGRRTARQTSGFRG